MKHATLFSITTLASLAACHDTTAPESKPLPVITSAELALSGVDVDSAALWSVMALDDASSRLAAGIPDAAARRELQAALHSLAAEIRRSNADAAASYEAEGAAKARGAGSGGTRAAARAVLSRITRGADASLLPELEAIGLALDQTERVLGGTR